MKKWMNYLPYALVIIILASLIIFSNDSRTENMDYSTFMQEAESMDIQESTISVGTTVIDVQGIYESDRGTRSFTVSVPKTDENIQWLTETLNKDGAKLHVTDPNRENQFVNILVSLLPVLLMVGLFFLFFSKMNAGGNNKAFDFAKSRAKIQSNVKVRFKDVAGCDEEKEEVREIIDYLKNPKQFTDMGARIPKGLLMVGPPGTGKTLLAKAVAGEADVPFFSISGSDFVEMFVGTGASRVRDMFKKAQQAAPCIVFIDEIDAVGRQRGAGMGGGNDEREQTLNQLLVEMDGFDQNDSVIMIAATNRVDILDPALLRPGRFDRQVVVGRPDREGREKILAVHAKGKPMADDVDLDSIAALTSGFTGADLANLLNESALLAARRNMTVITNQVITESMERVIAGPERKGRVMTDKEKRTIAYHESGHALVGHLLEHADPVHKISIIARGQALGYTLSIPDEDRFLQSKSEMIDNLAMFLGGRTAEEICNNGDVTTGASNDLERATKMAKDMVTRFGMSDVLGHQVYGERDHNPFLGRDLSAAQDYSDDTARVIDEEVARLMTAAHDTAYRILSEHRAQLDTMAEVLLERETVEGKAVQMLLDDQWDEYLEWEKAHPEEASRKDQLFENVTAKKIAGGTADKPEALPEAAEGSGDPETPQPPQEQ